MMKDEGLTSIFRSKHSATVKINLFGPLKKTCFSTHVTNRFFLGGLRPPRPPQSGGLPPPRTPLGPWGLPPPDPRTGKNGTAVGPERPSARPTAVRRPSDRLRRPSEARPMTVRI